MKDCLVIIDVQKGFLTPETNHIPNKIKELLKNRKFDFIVSTKFINTTNTAHYKYLNWNEMMDNESQELDPYIESISYRVFEKSINSCFTEEFNKFIKKNDIDKLVFVGIDTDCCVLKSAFDCFDKLIPFEVLTDCCASTGGLKFHKYACDIMKRSLGI